MATLASGSSITLTLGLDGYADVATSAGFGRITATPLGESAQTINFGPTPYRARLGPYSEGASVTLENFSVATMTYDYPTAGSGSGGYLGSVASEAAMVALSAAVAGDECYRSDTGTYWKLRVAPYSSAGNWDELAPAVEDIRTFSFSGAGNYYLVAGAGAVLSYLLDTSVSSTPGITAYDNSAPSGPTVHGNINTTAGSNLTHTIGTPNVGAPFAAGLTLTITGGNIGRVIVRMGDA
jgi:hypothetical protein